MNSPSEFNDTCMRLVAKRALEGSEKLTTSQVIMLHRGIALMFPHDHSVHERASQIHNALAAAEKQQLQLFNSLES